MPETSQRAAKPKKSGWRRRARWPLALLLFFVLAEALAGQFVARPNRILRHSSDPEMVYEPTPGTWLGHAKFDVWRAPLYMVLDFVHEPDRPDASRTEPPDGYTLYRIDSDGCRQPSRGPTITHDDVTVLGSSQSFGMLLPDEETVPAQLQTALRARGLGDTHVGNCGVIGHHFLQTLRTAERVRARRRPKLNVVLVRPWHLLEQYDYTQVLRPESPALAWVIDRSNLARLLFYVAGRQKSQFESPLVPEATLDERLARYGREMGESHVRSIFFLLDDHHSDCAVLDRLEPILRRQGFPVERVTPPSTRGPRDSRNRYYIDHDEHWNAAGGALVVDRIVASVERELRGAE